MYDPWCSHFPLTGIEPFSSSRLRLSVFHSVTTLAPSKVLRQGSRLKDNHSPPPVLDPASPLALMLTATRVQQFPQLRSSLEYFENLQKQISIVKSYMPSNQMAEVTEHRPCDILSPTVAQRSFPGLLKLIPTEFFISLIIKAECKQA